MNFKADIEYNELSKDLQCLADIIGLEKVQLLIRQASGLYFYIPQVSYFDAYIKRTISENKGLSIKDISRNIGISEYHIRKYYNPKRRK